MYAVRCRNLLLSCRILLHKLLSWKSVCGRFGILPGGVSGRNFVSWIRVSVLDVSVRLTLLCCAIMGDTTLPKPCLLHFTFSFTRAGTFALVGAMACSNCSAGFYNSLAGSSSCSSSCPVGSFSGPGAQECTACPQGKVSSENASASCTSCPQGTYQEQSGSVTCDDCEAGKGSASLGAKSVETCEECAAGKAASRGSICTVCPMGRFAANATTDQGVGHEVRLEGATFCNECPAGYFTSTAASLVCQACAAGSASSTGSSSCTACAAGTFATVASSAW